MSENREFMVTTLAGLMTKEPLVQIDAPATRVQMTPEEARDLALNLLSAAEAALADMFLITFATERIGTDMERAAMLLQEFRGWRQRREDDDADRTG